MGASAVGERKNQKNEHLGVIFHAYGEKKTWSDLHKILHEGRYPGHNHRCKFWERSVNAFLRSEGSNFRLFHRLLPSSAVPCECVIMY